MADGITTMFGKAYDTVGSADKNLILQTRGDLKVKWGGKYIDLIKNGKINVDVDLLKKVDSKESIFKDGIYLVEKEDKLEVWLYIGGTLVNIFGEVGTSYVSFLEKLDVKAELKAIALSNIGFYYDTLEDAQNAQILKGIIFVTGSNKFYYAKDGNLTEYKLELVIPDPLVIGGVTIDGSSSTIKGAPLSIGYGDTAYITLNDKGVNVLEALVTLKDVLSEDYLQGSTGYAIFHNTEDNQTYLEIDVVRVRSELVYTNIKDVKYDELKNLANLGKLVKGKKYRITDFQNEWELKELYQKHDATGKFRYYWPVIVTAETKRTFQKEGYFCDNEKWVIEYDINFNYYSHTETDENGLTKQVYSKGRITKLTDEYGNSGNFDFKHHLFKYTTGSDDPSLWYFTYNISNPLYNTAGPNSDLKYDDYLNTHVNKDASQLGLIKNNTICIKEPFWENGIDDQGRACKKLVLYDDYIIFPNCTTVYPHDNKILASSGKYTIPGQFYGNTIQGLLLNVTEREALTIDFEFLNNTCGNIYIIGEYVAPTVLTDGDSLYEVFNLPNTSSKRTVFVSGKHYTGNTFGNITATSLPQDIINNTFKNITGCILNAPMLENIFDKDLLNVNFKCDQMNNNHITGTISTNNSAATYPIEATTFNNNVINDITTSAISCYGCRIIKNIINNIINFFISNTNLENNEIKDLNGDGSNPGGNTPGGDPVNPGGDTPSDPVNPSGTVNIISSEPSTTAVNDIMHGTHTNANPLLNTADSEEVIGYIESSLDSSYGTPSIYGVYIDEYGSMLNSVDVVATTESGRSYNIVGNISANSLTTNKKVHVWVQFSNSNQLGYVSVYQNAGSGSVTPGGDTPSGGETPTADSTLDTFIDKITGGASGSVKSTVLTNKISAQDTPNTYAYLQLGYNFVSGKSDVLKSWMLANMLAELTPYVNETSGICYETDPLQTGTDTATDYFVNAAEHFGQRRLNYINSESIYMDRINGAAQYSLFKHSDYSGTNSAAAAARTELYNKGVTQAVLRTNRTNLVFNREAAPHAFTIAPIGAPSNDAGSPDQVFTLSMITQYPTPASTGGTPLKDKELDANYLCNILGISASKYADFLNVCNDIGDAGGNPFKYTYARPRPGTWYRLNGNSGFTVPSGGSIYLCDCGIEFEDQSHSDYEDGYNADCSATNNGETYCEKDTRTFTDPSARSDAPNHDNPYKSYQSGHSTRAFMDLLLTLEVVGDTMSGGGSRIERIHQYCLNRVIVRAHWKSDTIAGRFAASMQIGYLNGYKAFHDKIAAL